MKDGFALSRASGLGFRGYVVGFRGLWFREVRVSLDFQVVSRFGVEGLGSSCMQDTV